MSYVLPTRNLVSQADQSMIESARIPRSTFTGQWTRKTTFDAGYLVPFVVDEILPGDHMTYDVTAYIRMATPLFPIFDNQKVETFFFFVPNRLVWANWIRFMGQQDTPASSIVYTVPQCISQTGGFTVGGLFDHMGLICQGQGNVAFSISANTLPLRGYNLIYNTWFRDENLIDSLTVSTADSNDSNGLYLLRLRAKAHDYFTSCLPWPQKFTAPTIALTGNAVVRGLGVIGGTAVTGGPASFYEGLQTTTTSFPNYIYTTLATSVGIRFNGGGTVGAGNPPQIFADLATTAGISINALRQSFAVQGLLERDARGGTRYIELVKSHFGVTSPDARQQRPEYIGGGSTPFNITPVAQTAPTAGVTVGALGAAGTAVGQHHASYAATEHGFVIGLINVRTELSYQQGLHPMWTRSTRYDYYWPSLAGLGEASVLRREIYATGDPANDLLVFGYQERWQEYRTRYSDVTGLMRSTSALTIDPWHLAGKFLAAPVLGQTFIEDTPPMTRVLAAGALSVNQQYLADILINRKATRPMPMFGTPITLGRF